MRFGASLSFLFFGEVLHMFKRPLPHVMAILQALLVAFLWSTSWVLIKFGLADIPALTFAGLRYGLAFLCLLPFALSSARLSELGHLSGQAWARLITLGLLFYALTQAAQYLGLAYMPAATVNLLLSFTTVVVALLGVVLLAEWPTALQWAGGGLYLVGALIYFYPASIPTSQIFGLVVVIIGVVANAGSAILGRRVNRDGDIHPLTVTLVGMGIGASLLLAAGILVEGLPRLSPIHWAIIGWLAVVNTAFAYTLWNHTLRTLSAMESSLINNTMLIYIPILALLFLGEQITWRAGIGLVLAGLGILVVQLGSKAVLSQILSKARFRLSPNFTRRLKQFREKGG
jgi:drug/metabolite transporter (DMT)-like permease